jgi:predicted acetyltransferase
MQANGQALPLGGIAGVGTHIDYRRRGLLRRIMGQQFEAMRKRGQSCAALWASQAAIYQRYSFSLVTSSRSYAVDTVDVGFSDGDPGAVPVRQVAVDDPATATNLQAMYSRCVCARARARVCVCVVCVCVCVCVCV